MPWMKIQLSVQDLKQCGVTPDEFASYLPCLVGDEPVEDDDPIKLTGPKNGITVSLSRTTLDLPNDASLSDATVASQQLADPTEVVKGAVIRKLSELRESLQVWHKHISDQLSLSQDELLTETVSHKLAPNDILLLLFKALAVLTRQRELSVIFLRERSFKCIEVDTHEAGSTILQQFKLQKDNDIPSLPLVAFDQLIHLPLPMVVFDECLVNLSCIVIKDKEIVFNKVDKSIVNLMQTILTTIKAVDQNSPLHLLPMATPNELAHHEVKGSNQLDLPCRWFANAVSLFSRQVMVDCDNRKYTYQEMHNRVQAYVSWLQGQNIKAGDKVAICLPRGVEAIAIRLALWWLGAVPGFISYEDLLGQQREKCTAFSPKLVIINDADNKDQLDGVALPKLSESVVAASTTPELHSYQANEMLYAVWSSGSAGKPTLSYVVAHDFSRFMQAELADETPLQHADYEGKMRIFAGGYPEFDFSLIELIRALLRGHCLVIPTGKPGPSWVPALQTTDCAMLTPTQLSMVCAAGDFSFKEGGRLDLAGEYIGPDIIDLARCVCKTGGIAVWGPSQCGPYLTRVNYLKCDPGLLGRVINNASISILAWPLLEATEGVGYQQSVTVPFGVSGVLCIEVNKAIVGHYPKELIVKTPDKKYWFVTNDLAVLSENNNLRFLGRLNVDARKIKGHWVSRLEVQSAIQKKLSMDVIVQFEDDGLIAYIVTQTSLKDLPREHDLRTQLSDVLQLHQMPTEIKVIDRLYYRSGSTKLDLQAVKQAGKALFVRVGDNKDLTKTERLLVNCMQSLGFHKISLDHVFFAHKGARSSSAVELAVKIHAQSETGIDTEKLARILIFSQEITLRTIAQGLSEGVYSQAFASSKPPTLRPGTPMQGSDEAVPLNDGLSASVKATSPNSDSPVRFFSELPVVSRQSVDRPALSFSGDKVGLNGSQLSILDAKGYNIPIIILKLDVEKAEKAENVWLKVKEAMPFFCGCIQDGALVVSEDSVRLSPLKKITKCKEVDLLGVLETFIEGEEFDLNQGPLSRACLIPVGEDQYCFAIVVHHAVLDGPSCGLIGQYVISLFEGKKPAAFDILLKSTVDVKETSMPLGLYASSITMPPIYALQPKISSRSKTQTYEVSLPRDQLEVLSASLNQSPNITMLALLVIVMPQVLNMKDLVFLVPTDVRKPGGRYVGYENVTALVQPAFDSGLTLIGLVRVISKQILYAYQSKNSLPELLKKLQAQISDANVIMFSDELSAQVAENEIDSMALGIQTRFPLEVFTRQPKDKDYQLFLRANNTFIPSHMIDALGLALSEVFLRLTELESQAVASLAVSEDPVFKLTFQGGVVVDRVSESAVAAAVPLPKYDIAIALRALFETYPEKKALVSDEMREQTTTQFLDQVANIVQLMKERDVKSGDTIFIFLSSTVEFYAFELAALLLGVIFLPLDADRETEESTLALAKTLSPKLIFCQAKAVAALDPFQKCCVTAFLPKSATTWASVQAEILEGLAEFPTNQSAYYMPTSGSTGDRKIVCINRGGFLSRLQQLADLYKLDSETVYLSPISPAFDVHLLWFAVLFGGGSTRFMSLDLWLTATSEELGKRLTLCNLIQLESGMAQLALDKGVVQLPAGVIIGGSAVSSELAQRLLDAKLKVLYHMYGPAEDCIWSAGKTISFKEQIADYKRNIPFGQPFSDVEVRVVNDDNQAVLRGAPGQLQLSSPSTGHYLKAEHNDARFVVDKTGKKWFKTGDIVIQEPEKAFVFLWRYGFKSLGRVVDVQTVEQSVARLPEVQSAHVVVPNGMQKPVCVVFPKPMLLADEMYSELEKKFQAGWREIWEQEDDVRTSGWTVGSEAIEMKPRHDTLANLCLFLLPADIRECRMADLGSGQAYLNDAMSFRSFKKVDITDISSAVLSRSKKDLRPIKTVTTHCCSALDFLTNIIRSNKDKYQLILMNSVAQYGSWSSLLETLKLGIQCLKEGGSFVLGDVRDLSKRFDAALLYTWNHTDHNEKLVVGKLLHEINLRMMRDRPELLISLPWLAKQINELMQEKGIVCFFRQCNGLKESFLRMRQDLVITLDSPSMPSISEKAELTYDRSFVLSNLASVSEKPIIVISNIEDQCCEVANRWRTSLYAADQASEVRLLGLKAPEDLEVVNQLQGWADKHKRQLLLYEVLDGLKIILVKRDVPGLNIKVVSLVRHDQESLLAQDFFEETCHDPVVYYEYMQHVHDLVRSLLYQSGVLGLPVVVFQESVSPRLPNGKLNVHHIASQAVKAIHLPVERKIIKPREENPIYAIYNSIADYLREYKRCEVGLTDYLPDLGLMSLDATQLHAFIVGKFRIDIGAKTQLLEKDIEHICKIVLEKQEQKLRSAAALLKL